MRSFKSLSFVVLALALANCTKIEADKGPIPPVFHEASQCPKSSEVDLEIQENDNGISVISEIGPQQDLLIDGEEHTMTDPETGMPRIYRGGCFNGGFSIYYRDGGKMGVLSLKKEGENYSLADVLEGVPVGQPKVIKKAQQQ